MLIAERLISKYKLLKPDERLIFDQLKLEERNREQNKDREVEVFRKVESVYKPFAVAPLGDLHLGSGAAALLTTRKYIQNLIDNGVYVVGTGDWIESIKPAHGVATLQASSPIFDQIELVQQEVLAPLVQAELLLAIVRGHIAHEEWLVNMLGDDPWKRILGGYGDRVQMVNNGGILTLNLEDEEKREGQLVFQVNHNSESSGRAAPLRPLVNLARRYGANAGPDVILAAHDHKAAVGLEKTASGQVTMIRGGTHKGIDGNPDSYGVALGMGEADELEQGTVLWRHKGNGEILSAPYMKAEVGMMTLAAMKLWEICERQGISDEVVGEVRKNENLRMKIQENLVSWEKAKRAPQFDKIGYQIQSRLPVGILPIVNTRIGSQTHERRWLKWGFGTVGKRRNIWDFG